MTLNRPYLQLGIINGQVWSPYHFIQDKAMNEIMVGSMQFI